jgi:flavodoxin
MKSLVVFYSRTGNTSMVALKIASLFHADTDRILSRVSYDGFLGFPKAVFHSVTGRQVPIDPPKLMPDGYDLVIVGGPIWAGHIAPPVQTYLRQFRGRFKHVAFCLTHAGSPAASSFREMESLSGMRPAATLAVTAKDIAGGRYDFAVRSFLKTLEQQFGEGRQDVA